MASAVFSIARPRLWPDLLPSPCGDSADGCQNSAYQGASVNAWEQLEAMA
jgi:hypothetical protein